MRSILNLCGLPLCLSGITHPQTLSKEMADHERRREEIIRKQKMSTAQGRGVLFADHGVGIVRNHERVLAEIREDEVRRDLAGHAGLLHDPSNMCTAKAA